MFVRSISSILLALSVGVCVDAQACNLKQSAPGVITLSVSSGGCTANATDVARMASALKSAIAAMPSGVSNTARDRGDTSSRLSREQKLRNLDDMAHQQRFLSGLSPRNGYYAYPMKR
jgi:hypothetical protein